MLGGMLAGHDEGGGKVVIQTYRYRWGITKHPKEHLFLTLKNRILFSFMA